MFTLHLGVVATTGGLPAVAEHNGTHTAFEFTFDVRYTGDRQDVDTVEVVGVVSGSWQVWGPDDQDDHPGEQSLHVEVPGLPRVDATVCHAIKEGLEAVTTGRVLDWARISLEDNHSEQPWLVLYTPATCEVLSVDPRLASRYERMGDGNTYTWDTDPATA